MGNTVGAPVDIGRTHRTRAVQAYFICTADTRVCITTHCFGPYSKAATDVNKQENEYGRTPLFGAVAQGRIGCVEVLVATARVDVNKTDEDGRTPLFEAALGGHIRCVEVLLDSPAVDVNITTYNGINVLTAAASHVLDSFNTITSTDACRPLVRLLASRRVSRDTLDRAIATISTHMPTDAQAAEASDHDHALSMTQQATALLLPVLQAEASATAMHFP